MFCVFFAFFEYEEINNSHVLVLLVASLSYILASGLQKELFDQVAGTAGLVYTLVSAWPLKGLVVEISHNAFSHRETSSQHEQGRNVARVWERPSGWREGVTAQRTWSRRKEGSVKGAAEFLFSSWAAFQFSYQQEKVQGKIFEVRGYICIESLCLHTSHFSHC